jgi:hypothetical protein
MAPGGDNGPTEDRPRSPLAVAARAVAPFACGPLRVAVAVAVTLGCEGPWLRRPLLLNPNTVRALRIDWRWIDVGGDVARGVGAA